MCEDKSWVVSEVGTAAHRDVQLLVVSKLLIPCPVLASGYHVGGQFPLLACTMIATIYCFLRNSISLVVL
jgi:hypothetical protein